MLAIMLPIVNSSAGSIFAGGDGTEENPYLINTTTQLKIINDLPDMNYKLIGDLDLSNVSWVTVGTQGDNFSGTFDGNYHKIINAKSTLFDKNNGTIKNLVVEDTTSNIINSNYGTIYNCSVSGKSGALNNAKGLLVNYNSGLVANCCTYGSIEASASGGTCNAGGIIGENDGELINSYSTASLNGSSASHDVFDPISHSYYGKDGVLRIGNIVGQNKVGSIKNCYGVGIIKNKYGYHSFYGHEYISCGGLVGYTGSDSVVTDSYYNKDNANYTGTNESTPNFV